MLNLLDELLRKILMEQVESLRATADSPSSANKVDETQIGFQPPDSDWSTVVKGRNVNALNLYLVDLRENRKLRTNERERRVENGVALDLPAPTRLDCHYLISAWSPTDITTQTTPTLDEHLLLYQTTAVLLKNAPLNPSKIYPTNLNKWPEQFKTVDLPAVVLPSEGFPKLAEFWGTMGQGNRWKPVVYLIVTLPIALVTEVAGPLVTTRITEYRQDSLAETAEVRIQIGGTLYDKSGSPVSRAWVRLETASNEPLQTTTTDDTGHFTFGNLQPGQYQLRARAVGLGEVTSPNAVDVPSLLPDGTPYDLRFS
jgi:hypothetical protein